MSLVELTRLQTRKDAEDLKFILRGGGVHCAIEPVRAGDNGSGVYWAVLVSARDLDEARAILQEEGLAHVHGPRLPEMETTPARPPGLYWIVGLMLANLLVWVAMEGQGSSEDRAILLRFGASHAPRLLAGEWWRTITAVFVHIGLRHLLANMITLVVLGPPVLQGWGIGRFYFMYLTAGVAGNWISFALSPTGSVKAGASGAILGLLGVLAGARLRSLRARTPSPPTRFKAWHIIAMLIAFYGFVVGVGGTVDHLAHIGGLVTGGVVAFVMPPPGTLDRRTERILGPGLASASLLLLVVAALLAYRAA